MSAIENDDLLGALERLVERGTVRMAGVSGEHDVIAESFARRPRGLRTAQFAMNAGTMSFATHTREAAEQGWFLVANQPFGGAAGAQECRRQIERMRGDADLPSGLRAKLDPDEQMMPEAVLNMILRGTGVHAAVPAMMRPEHVAANVCALDRCRFTGEELEYLRQALGGGMRVGG
jgi:aryl-alcohol dehydrogenase-like predicted oxidoreductase